MSATWAKKKKKNRKKKGQRRETKRRREKKRAGWMMMNKRKKKRKTNNGSSNRRGGSHFCGHTFTHSHACRATIPGIRMTGERDKRRRLAYITSCTQALVRQKVGRLDSKVNAQCRRKKTTMVNPNALLFITALKILSETPCEPIPHCTPQFFFFFLVSLGFLPTPFALLSVI